MSTNGPCLYHIFRSDDAPVIQLSFHKWPVCEDGMRMTMRLIADLQARIFVVEDRDTKQELCIVVNTGCRLKELSGGIVNQEFPEDGSRHGSHNYCR